MKKRVFFAGIFLALVCLFFPKPFTAAAYEIPDDAYEITGYPYEIQGYQVNIKVTSANVYQIEEKLSVDFNQGRHGIIRKIPLINHVERTEARRQLMREFIILNARMISAFLRKIMNAR